MQSTRPVGLSLCTSTSGPPCVVALSGTLDAHSQVEAERFFQSLVATGATRVVLDCSQLDFISSAGIRAFILLIKLVRPIGGAVSICAAKPHVRQMLEFTGLQTLLALSDSVEQGCAALAQERSPN